MYVTFIILGLLTFPFTFGSDKHHSSSKSVSLPYSRISVFINIIVLKFSSSQSLGKLTTNKFIDSQICGAANQTPQLSGSLIYFIIFFPSFTTSL
jgi:hypothetical protein